MGTEIKKALYPTEPLKIWDEAKQLRAKYFLEYVEAKKNGKLRILSGTTTSPALASGFGDDVRIMGIEPLLANLSFHSDFSLQSLTAAEGYGFAREMCGMSKLIWGSAILNKFVMTDGTILNEWPIPDFILCLGPTACHNKLAQFLAEYKDIPSYFIDTPQYYPHNFEHVLKYMTTQVLDAIDWMEKKTQRIFNDELFIKCVHNHCNSFRLWSKTMLLNQNIPAPLDEKTIFALIGLNVLRPYSDEVVSFYSRLLEEVEDRVARGIAAVANEQFRIISDAIPPWPYLNIWRYLEREYGIVSVGSPYSLVIAGSWKFDDKGNLVPVPTPEEMNMKVTNREEAVRALLWFKSHFSTESNYTTASVPAQHELVKAIARQWKAQAAILHLNRGCPMQGMGGVESKNALLKAGIRSIFIEGSCADPRELNMVRVKEEIDVFLDFLGIRKPAALKS